MKKNTDFEFYSSEENFIRSSSLKSLDSCSWLYYCNYILKIPQQSNDGARMGTICHSIFECLLNPRHKKNYNKIIEYNSLKGSISVLELVWKLMKDNDLPELEDIYKKIENMILVGLKTNFFVKDEILIGSEKRIKYKNESPKYLLFATMDKIVEKGDNIIIYDWKSSKKKYEGEEKSSNLQALLYSLIATKLWPDKKPIIRFVFLQYPEDPIIEIKYDLETLKGFEYYLESVYKQTSNFTEKDGMFNFAIDKGLPKDGSFSGSLSCGYSKSKGHTKKTGELYWACPFKWGFSYYAIKKENKTIYCVLNKNDIKTLKDGETVEELKYLGCPKFNNIDKTNPLDDF